MKNTATRNKDRGLDFESIFEKRAFKEGHLIIKNHTQGRWIPWPRRRFIPIKGELDFKMIRKSGQVSYLDCKTFSKAYFIFSEIDEAQLSRSTLYNVWGIVSGFIVYFMEIDRVGFISGAQIKAKGQRSRFTIEDCIDLGPLLGFEISKLWGTIPGAHSLLSPTSV